MAVSKGLIAGVVVVGLGLCIGLGWWLGRTHDRRDAGYTAEERAVIAAAHAKAAESRRKTMADMAASAAREAIEDQKRRQHNDALDAKLRESQARVAAFRETPRERGLTYLRERHWKKLDELVESLAASGKRAPDGQFELQLLTSGIGSTFKYTEESDEEVQKTLAAYQQERPESVFAPLLPAMQLHAAGWRARGTGFSSNVTAEGWKLFAERNRQAWKQIQASRPRSNSLPTWYEQAIKIGLDAGIERDQLNELFEEGIGRFPGYHAIYAAFVRQFVPRWGGNYADADAFVRAQVAAASNPEGEALYTHLYWEIDARGGYELRFFEDSLVDWSRMRAGFEALLKKYPEKLNRASFASYACRAGDGSAYLKLRKDISKSDFFEVAPQGVSLEVCDARFITST